ncbi:MAG: hypothetical protein H6613_18220 [Ignavibacteriales bacterium]|nr:hypothetical protein [Ignavibacteriales bacterium]
MLIKSKSRTVNKSTDVKKEVKRDDSSLIRKNNSTNKTAPRSTITKTEREVQVKRETTKNFNTSNID